jgi:hypothetical protein
LSGVATHNVSVNDSLRITSLSKLKRDHQEALDLANLKSAAVVSKLRKDTADKFGKLKSASREKDELISGLQEMAEDVAQEYSALDRSARARRLS